MPSYLVDSSVLLDIFTADKEWVEWNEIPREALFLAGKAWMTYRRRGGPRLTPLPDFFIGAHAAVLDLVLVTRDAERVRSYFPSVRLVDPKTT